MSIAAHELVQSALQQFVQANTPQSFRESLPVFKEKYGDDAEWVGAAYGAFLGEILLAPAGFFAVLHPAPQQTLAMLAEIERTVSAIDYPRAPRGLDKQARPYYQAFARFAQATFPVFAAAMRAVLTHYIALEDGPAADPDTLIETALDEAEQDLPRAQDRIAQAAALMLAGQRCWPRWGEETRGPAGAWLGRVMHVADVLGGIGLQGTPEEARREWAALAETAAAVDLEEEDEEEEEEDPLHEEIFARLLRLQDQPLPAELFELCQAHRDQAVPLLISIVEEDNLWPDDAPGEGWAPIRAVELLGQLQAVEAVPLLIDLVADYAWDDMIRDQALVALEEMGPAAKPDLLRFLRFSRNNEARTDLTWGLVQNCPDDEEVYQALLTLLPQVSWDECRGFIYEALAETGDPRGIPLLQEALQDPTRPLREGREIAGLLEDLGGAVPEGYEAYAEEQDLPNLADPRTIQDLVASLPPAMLDDPDDAAHMIVQVWMISSYPLFLYMVLSSAEEGALSAYLAQLRELRFDADITAAAEQHQAVLRHLAECAGPQMLEVLAGLEAILDAYAAGRYDLDIDPDEQIAQARALLSQDAEAARRLVGQAGAAALRGANFWPRWPDETLPPLADWLWALRSFLHYLRSTQRYPLAEIAAERERPGLFADTPPAAEPALPGTAPERPGEVQELLNQLVALSAESIQPPPELLAGFERWREAAIPALVELLRDARVYEEETVWAAADMAARLLGYLEAAEAAPMLVDVIAETEWDEDLHEAAQRALVAIGRPAYPAIAAYLRYGQNVMARVALAEALARTGDKDAATFPLLSRLWEEADWPQQRRLVAVALADLGDRRAIPLLQDALDNPRSDFADQVHVRWALQRLGRHVDLFPSSRLFYGLLDRRARISTPILWPPALDLDAEQGTARRARYTIWGAPICHHCGLPMVLDGEKGWTHPEAARPAPPERPAVPKKSRRKKRKR